MTCLQIEDLRVATASRKNSVELLHGVEVTVQAGSVTALLGVSGSGKSLTCTAAQGLLPSGLRRISGRVLLDGAEMTPEQLRGRQVATIMQNPRSAFNPVLSMRAHAQETLAVAGQGRQGFDAAALSAMHQAGLDRPEELLDLYPFQMSGGMLQRMMIALALMSGAPFLFADEPTTDLDLVVQMQVLALLDRLVRQSGIGILLVTHDLGVVARLADRVCVMHAGRIVERADTASIFAAPQHKTTRALVAAHLSLYEKAST